MRQAAVEEADPAPVADRAGRRQDPQGRRAVRRGAPRRRRHRGAAHRAGGQAGRPTRCATSPSGTRRPGARRPRPCSRTTGPRPPRPPPTSRRRWRTAGSSPSATSPSKMKANEQQLNAVSAPRRAAAARGREAARRRRPQVQAHPGRGRPAGRRDRRRGQGPGRADPHRVRARALGRHPAPRQHQRPAHQRPADARHPDRCGAARPDRRRADRTGRRRADRSRATRRDRPSATSRPTATSTAAGAEVAAVARQDAGRGRRPDTPAPKGHAGGRPREGRRQNADRTSQRQRSTVSPEKPSPPSADGGRPRRTSAAADARSAAADAAGGARRRARRPGRRAGGAGRTRDAAARPRSGRDALRTARTRRSARLGRPIRRDSPFMLGFLGALGVFARLVPRAGCLQARSVLVLIAVALFLAIGLSPIVEWLIARGMRRGLAIGIVFLGVIAAFVGFGFAVLPPVDRAEQRVRQGAAELPGRPAQEPDDPPVRPGLRRDRPGADLRDRPATSGSGCSAASSGSAGWCSTPCSARSRC